MTHTPGPWFWEKTLHRGKSKGWRLVTAKNGHCIVMDFARSGMRKAQPVFSDRGDTPLGGIMIDADGIDNLNKHPDARLMAASPNLLKACEAALVAIESVEAAWPKQRNAELEAAKIKLRGARALARGEA